MAVKLGLRRREESKVRQKWNEYDQSDVLVHTDRK